jgi:hypothetical protein
VGGEVVDGHRAGPGGAGHGAVGGALVVELTDLVAGGGITYRLVGGCGLAGGWVSWDGCLGSVPGADRKVARLTGGRSSASR